MSQAEQDRRVDYVEFGSTNIEETKTFYSGVFDWEFTDYGPDYTSFSDGRLAGGFSMAPEVQPGGPLVVIYSTNLAEVEARIGEGGGQIVRAIFEFPTRTSRRPRGSTRRFSTGCSLTMAPITPASATVD